MERLRTSPIVNRIARVFCKIHFCKKLSDRWQRIGRVRYRERTSLRRILRGNSYSLPQISRELGRDAY